jgi:hypothetical protein
MKLLARDSSELVGCIDEGVSAETSVVLRYRDAVQLYDDRDKDLAFKSHLLKTSIREGIRVFPLLTYRGVDIHILDETSLMATGSLKAIDGCLTASFCRTEGVERVAFESGGNTGSAITRYGQGAGLETFFFCPADNVDLLDSRLFDGRRAHLIGVEERGKVKEATDLFARTTGIRRVPEKPWRHAASVFRGLSLVEHLICGREYAWIVQTVSAGFGPIGIYSVLKQFREEVSGLPRFLGVQQESNCPMYRAWTSARGAPAVREEERGTGLLTRVMYDDTPQTYLTYGDLEALLVLTGGDMLTISEREFGADTYPGGEDGRILATLRENGVAITLRAGRILEKTGLIALAGTLKAIDTGLVEGGAKVLCCLTSGVSGADDLARPEVTVRDEKDVLEYSERVISGR